MATWRVNNSTTLGGEVCSPWQANHAYALGARCVCTVAYATTAARAVVFECTTAGTSGGSQPTWDYTVGNTTSDGEVTWTTRSPSDGSWDNASCYLYYVTNHAAAAGDTIYVDDGHSESSNTSAHITITGSSSASNPIKIICVDKATDSLSTGAIVYHNPPNTAYRLYLSKFAYSYGITYKARCNLHVPYSANTLFVIESGGIHIAYPESPFMIGSADAVQLVLINSDITLDNANNFIRLNYTSQLLWRGGSLVAPNGVTTLFAGSGSQYIASNIEDVDLSALGNNILLYVTGIRNGNAVFSRCKVPSSYTPVTGTWSIGGGSQVNLYHCSSANRTYDVYKACYEGTVEDETTIVRTDGASDGTTSLAMKMVSSVGIVEGAGIALTSPPIHAWTSSTTSKTFTIEGIWDSATNIQDDEIWMELEYPANNTDGLGAIASDKCAILGTPTDQTASTATWGGITEEGRSSSIISPSGMTANNAPTPYVASTSDSSVNAYKLFDGTDSRWYVSGTSGWCKIDLGDIVGCGGYGITPSAWPAQAPKNWTFEGSNNNSDWTTLDTRTDEVFSASTRRIFDLTTHGDYRYYRLNVSASYNGSYVDMEEFCLYGSTYLTNPNKFKLSVTVTPGKAGPITARVCLAKPSTIVYIDPKITES